MLRTAKVLLVGYIWITMWRVLFAKYILITMWRVLFARYILIIVRDEVLVKQILLKARTIVGIRSEITNARSVWCERYLLPRGRKLLDVRYGLLGIVRLQWPRDHRLTPEKAIKACRSSLSACETLGDFGPGGLVSASKEWDAEEVKERAGRSDWLFEFRWLALRPDEVRLVGGFGAVQ